MAKKYLTVAEVADHLQLAIETVYMYARTGVLPGSKIGKHWRFSMDRIEEWISRREAVEPGSGLRVLIVEPDVQIAEAFNTWFSEAGCEVYAVASREQAYPLLNEKHFDVILLDLMDLRLGGLETLREIHAAKPAAEIVVAASRFDADMMDRALDIGPLTVLRRPVAKVDVQRLVESHKQDAAQRRTPRPDGPARGARPAVTEARPPTVENRVRVHAPLNTTAVPRPRAPSAEVVYTI